MTKLDDEINQLYKLPLSEFTKARDELAKRFEKDKARIRALQKPNVAAWSVNQLYWRDRGKYEALVAAAAKVRAAQLGVLKGKNLDADSADGKHATARRAALDRIREILSEAGEALSPATISAINETLEALPTEDQPGRLVRPLKPMGFHGLAGMLKTSNISLRRAEVVPFKKPPASPEARPEKAADTRKEIQALTAALRAAKEAERVAASAHNRAQRTLEQAKQVRDRTMEALDAATDRLGVATRDLSDREKIYVAAVAAREAAEKQLAVKKG